VAIKQIDDPQMFLINLSGPSVLFQYPLGGHAIQIWAAVSVQTVKVAGWIEEPWHFYWFSRFRSSQLTLESAWISVQSLL
jgi:hypothetical protein